MRCRIKSGRPCLPLRVCLHLPSLDSPGTPGHPGNRIGSGSPFDANAVQNMLSALFGQMQMGMQPHIGALERKELK